MHFDNGLFALELPTGWHATEAEDGNIFVSPAQADGVWVSIQVGGVDGGGKEIDDEAFIRSAYGDKLDLPDAIASLCEDGRRVVRWSESREHDGAMYVLVHGLAAWKESPSNLQLLMFQGAFPEDLAVSPEAQAAKEFAWEAPATLRFYRWHRQSAA
jgi:hypothetical protein